MELLREYYTYCHGILWSEKFWHTYNSSWKDFEDMQEGPHKGVIHPQISSLYWAPLFAIALCLFRILLELFVLNPLADNYGLKNIRTRYPVPVSLLDKFFRNNRRPSHDDVKTLATQLRWSTRQVERWFRVKRNYRKSTIRRKFNEAGWRFTFYLVAFFIGVYVLHDEELAYDWSLSRAMDTWPHHHIKTEYWFYYVLEMGFYMSLFVSLFTDVRRSDFMTMTVHHALTIILLSFSWVINCVRIGLITLILHDSADYFLEAAKIFNYLKKEKLTQVTMVIFVIVWIITRVYLFPVHLIYPTWQAYYAWYASYGHFPSVMLQTSFLTVLVVLNMIWTYYITLTVIAVCKGTPKDERSDSEVSEVSSDNEAAVDIQNGRNGHTKSKHE